MLTITESQVTNLTTDLAAKAPLASPALTGTPTAPTATAGTNTTQIATTAFVTAATPASATTTTQGIIQLAGDLTGTATSPALAAAGTAGTYTKVTTDSKGRVTSGTTLSATDIPAALSSTTSVNGTTIPSSATLATSTDLALKAPLTSTLKPTATQTGSTYSASAGDFVIAAPTAAAMTITLPSAPANGSIVAVISEGTQSVSVVAGTGDTLRTSITIGASQPVTSYIIVSLVYNSTTKVWDYLYNGTGIPRLAGANTYSQLNSFNSGNATMTPVVIKGFASQTAQLLKVNDSTSTIQFSIDNTGTGASPVWATNANGNKVINLANGSSAQDAVAYGQLANYLPLAGGTMTGYLNLSGQSGLTGGSTRPLATILANQYNQIQSATLATNFKLPDLAATGVNIGDFVVVQNTGTSTITASIYPYSVGGATSTQTIDGSSGVFNIAANATAIFWCTSNGSSGTWSSEQLDLGKGKGILPLANVTGVLSGSTALSSDLGGLRPVGSMYYGGSAIAIATGSTTTLMNTYTMTSNYAVGGMTVNTAANNSGLQVPVAGYYQVNACQQVQSSSSANRLGMSIHKNAVSTPILQGNFMTNGTTNNANFILVASGIVLLAANDVLSWQVFNSAATLTINPGAALSTLSATLVGT